MVQHKILAALISMPNVPKLWSGPGLSVALRWNPIVDQFSVNQQ